MIGGCWGGNREGRLRRRQRHNGSLTGYRHRSRHLWKQRQGQHKRIQAYRAKVSIRFKAKSEHQTLQLMPPHMDRHQGMCDCPILLCSVQCGWTTQAQTSGPSSASLQLIFL